MDYILQTNNICKNYGSAKVLQGITMNIPKGSIYGFVGRNGAGKTTLIRVVTGLHNPTSGEYSLYGISNSDKKILDIRKKTGAVVETPSIYLEENAKENLKLQCSLLGYGTERIDEVLHLVGLSNTGKKRAKNFSLGMRQRLGIAMCLMSNPDFLFLDEPTNGLDPQGIIEIRELLLDLNRKHNITILISSHILDELSKLATHYGFIEKGKIIREMSSEELENSSKSYTKITVSDIKIFSNVLDEMKLNYKIISETEANVFSDFKLTPLVLTLHEKGCEVISMSENHEGLESYFVNLVGGEHNV